MPVTTSNRSLEATDRSRRSVRSEGRENDQSPGTKRRCVGCCASDERGNACLLRATGSDGLTRCWRGAGRPGSGFPTAGMAQSAQGSDIQPGRRYALTGRGDTFLGATHAVPNRPRWGASMRSASFNKLLVVLSRIDDLCDRRDIRLRVLQRCLDDCRICMDAGCART